MTADIDLFGIFVPASVLFALLAYLLKIVLGRLLARLRIDPLLTHNPLLGAALFLVLFAVLVRGASLIHP